MSCEDCARLEAGPVVTLVDGSQCCSYCELWRVECEARHILKMPSRDLRRDYIERIKAKRGEAAGRQLADVVLAVWEARRPA